MDRDDQAWPVFWCSLLSPLLLGEVPEAEREAYFRTLAEQERLLPNGQRKRISVRPLRRWWKRLRDEGVEGTLRRRRNEPPILDYELGASSSRGNVLDLRVVAYDAVGLLAAVLHRVRACGLALDEMMLATEDDAATHRLAIRRLDSSPPRSIDRRAIASSLDQMVRSR